jgi:hypothetical protein
VRRGEEDFNKKRCFLYCIHRKKKRASTSKGQPIQSGAELLKAHNKEASLMLKE